jgi:Fur family zinc uptake transcriptional regulator
MQMIGFEHHDHASCISDGVAAVGAQCRQAGLQFTPVRRRVLEILLAEHRAMGAYDILDRLRVEGLGSQPPVVYRALSFLTKHGFAHKIERLNAFIACVHPGEAHAPAFLICRICASVAEMNSDSLKNMLGRTAKDAGFEIECTIVEAQGVCPNCRESNPA